MIQDIQQEEDDNFVLSQVDLELALTFLEQVTLPPICVNWTTGFQFMVRQFQPEQLVSQRIHTFRYIPQDAQPLFRKCYVAVLTLLNALPEYDESPTVNFLHKRVISFLTALPALLVSQVPGLGPNCVLDTIKTNCQQFLEAKPSHLYHTARKLHAQPSTTIHPNDSKIVQNRNDERLFRTVHQLVLGRSLRAAYQRLTEPGLCQTDPLPRFLEIHRDIYLTSLNLHLDSVQDVRNNVD
jgi:hypothetical protein